MNTTTTERTQMNGTDRAWWVGVTAAVGAAALGLVITLPKLGDASGKIRLIGFVATAVGAIAIGVLGGTVWSRIEDAIEQRNQGAAAIRAQLADVTAALIHQANAAPRQTKAAELLAELVADGALSWGAGPALGTMRVRVEYEDEAFAQDGEALRRRPARMRLIQSGLDLLAARVRIDGPPAPGMRLDGDTVQVLDVGDDTVLIAIRATAGNYLAVEGLPRGDWHAFTVSRVALLTSRQALQHGITLA